VPPAPVAKRSIYLKFRDRESYEFALVSVGVAMRVEDGTIAEARLALGGIATKPWRARLAEQSLIGRAPTKETFQAAARAELAAAVPRTYNAFKIELAHRAIVRGLTTVLEGIER
jgi:xanthine dehydrogenase YagS FAD-binding subunit